MMENRVDKDKGSLHQQIPMLLQTGKEELYKPVNYSETITYLEQTVSDMQILAIRKGYKFLYDFLKLYLDVITFMKDNINDFSPYEIRYLKDFFKDIEKIYYSEKQGKLDFTVYNTIKNGYLTKVQEYLDSGVLWDKFLDLGDVEHKYNISIPILSVDSLLSSVREYKFALMHIMQEIEELEYLDNSAFNKNKKIVAKFNHTFNKFFQERKNFSLKSLYKYIQENIYQLNKERKKRIELHFHGHNIEIDRDIMLRLKFILKEMAYALFDYLFTDDKEEFQRGDFFIDTYVTQGNFVIVLSYKGGRPIQVDNTANIALSEGIIDSAEGLSNNDKFSLIFNEYFLNYENVSLDSLKRAKLEIDLLLGDFKVTEEKDPRSCTISLPLNFRAEVLEIQLGTIYSIPNFYIKEIISANQIEVAESDKEGILVKTIEQNNKTIPFISMESYLNLEVCSIEQKYVCIIEVGKDLMAFGIDTILNKKDVYIRSLNKNLAFFDKNNPPKLPFVLGAFQLKDNHLGIVLDMYDLIKTVKLCKGSFFGNNR